MAKKTTLAKSLQRRIDLISALNKKLLARIDRSEEILEDNIRTTKDQLFQELEGLQGDYKDSLTNYKSQNDEERKTFEGRIHGELAEFEERFKERFKDIQFEVEELNRKLKQSMDMAKDIDISFSERSRKTDFIESQFAKTQEMMDSLARVLKDLREKYQPALTTELNRRLGRIEAKLKESEAPKEEADLKPLQRRLDDVESIIGSIKIKKPKIKVKVRAGRKKRKKF